MDLSKIYDPAPVEQPWYEYWVEQGFFRSVPDSRPAYTIVIPPPNVTGMLHIGHVLNNTIQDVLIRRKRMEGYNACWVPGTDHASIATEAKVVGMLRERGIKKSDLSREEFLKYAWEWKEKYGGIILKQLRQLGASVDWDRTHFTMDKDYYNSVIHVFIDLYNKGHIYRGLRMVNWDPAAQTTISNEEVQILENQPARLFYVRYKVKDSDEYVTIATTRPETIMADTAVAVNPNDERYRHLIGKRAIVPMVNREVPIIADEYVEKDFGTGCLKVTPAHDANDYEIGKRHNLEVIDILHDDGRLNEKAQIFIGEDRFVARKMAVKKLKELEALVKTEDIRNNSSISERTGAIVEPRLKLQWFLKMKEISKPALEAVRSGEVNLIPDRFLNTYIHWMENVQDWCISRQLWWGHRIPAWYAPDGRYAVALTAEEACIELNKGAPDLTGPELAMDRGNITWEEFQNEYVSRWVKPEQLTQDPDVMDTWFSSWLWPMEVFKGISNPGNKEIDYYYPTQDLVTAPEILFFWVARMIIAGYEYKGKAPFKNVYLTGIMRDAEGRKISKSLGNSPDPLDLFNLFGTDGVRAGILLPSSAGNDLKFDLPLKINSIDDIKSKYFEQGRNFLNKIWNGLRLVKSWEPKDSAGASAERKTTESLATEWMQAKVEAGKAEVADLFEKMRIPDALQAIYKLVWDDFCSWYLEMMKPGMGLTLEAEVYEKVLRMFEELMQLAHPFVPFITEEVWHLLRDREKKDCITVSQLEPVNSFLASAPVLAEMEIITESITALRNLRREKNLPTRDPIKLVVKTGQEQLFTKYLPVLHKFVNIEELSFTQEALPGAAAARVRTHELYIPLAVSEVSEEDIDKIRKEIEYYEGFLSTVMKKLGNEKFMASAKPEIIEKERQKKSDAETKLTQLRDSLRVFGV